MMMVRISLPVFLSFFLTSASFANWDLVPSVGNQTVYSVYSTGDTLMAGTETETWFSIDAGLTWTMGGLVHVDAAGINTFCFLNGWMYAGTLKKGVFRSSDLGKTWTPVNSGLTGWALGINKIRHAGNGLLIATEGAGIFRWNGTDPVSWTSWNEDLSRSVIQEIFVYGNEVFATSGLQNYLFRRNLTNGTWNSSKMDTSRGETFDIFSITQKEDFLFAGTSGGIYRSSDYGETWKRVGTQFLSGDVRFMMTSGKEIVGVYVFSTDFFVVYSRDNGETWSVWDHWFYEVIDFAVQKGSFWTAHVGGLSTGGSIPVSVTDPDSRPEKTHLHQNYPNPFNPETIIPVELEKSDYLILSVFDINGKKIATLADGVFPAGKQEFYWKADRFSSGVYYCRLESGGKTQTRKLILLR